MWRHTIVAAFLLGPFASGSAGAQELPAPAPAPRVVEGGLNAQIRFFECVDPMTPEGGNPCMCLRAEQKATHCQPCSRWEERDTAHQMRFELELEAYRFDTGPELPRANFFARDVSDDLFGVDFPATEFGFPITTTEFYTTFEERGWDALPPEGSKVGSLAVWPGGVGLVVADGASGLRVLYPSARRAGELAEVELRFLTGDALPRYLVPTDWVERVAVGR